MKKLFFNATLAAVLLSFCSAAFAGTLTVRIGNIDDDKGRIGCALFKSSDGFPMGNISVRDIWIDATPRGVICEFENVEPGTYAVAVSHDLNGNQETDTNFLGIPREAWGVSNNVRPSMRAPNFEEAQFDFNENKTIEINIDK